MTRYIESPTEYTGDDTAIFLAGGISGCPDWQADAVTLLRDTPCTVLNPRRARYPMDDAAAAAQQVAWEHRHLHRASVILFWFPASPTSDQPIALYELGVHAATARVPVAVGADPAYRRHRDLILQMSVARPDITVHTTLADTVAAARTWLPPTR
ncbi:nucleoside 2-deoxyribosyltransferase domain-containing protein [Micromonospora sp. WMMD1082]|uniref:nucleoside 2-deoxyribosyltransferase domain-containing protein n=1 Tax=Micromonospora sp. WMMD1082 TaxID=3016104 RepID=UPI00241676B7|nr:nucleoside 2-deoxyribosyltransferase domain-containing protein [Micromonospora sp. WMMD1082]MDG4795218.1 nucleoside 2-deoxyribosyltransferase domain-containing protein [Micromonospora sp. WMMD1082]